MNKKVVAKPFVKWVGGKKSVAEQVLNRIPQEIDTYYEPMAGGAFILFMLARQKRYKKAVIADTNEELMNVYRVIKDDSKLHSMIDSLKSNKHFKYNKESYLEVRSWTLDALTSIERAARFIYLNRTCFNGLYRVNKSGQFNVPFGKHTNPTICDEANLHAVHEVLQNVDIMTADFKEAVKTTKKGDVVYFDPPYIPLSKTSNFTSYTSDGFDLEKHSELAKTANELSVKHIRVVLSNSSAPESLELYKDFDIDYITGSRNVGGPSSYRNSVKEIIAFAGPMSHTDGDRSGKTKSFSD